MRALIFAAASIAAVTVVAAPAQAQSSAAAGFTASHGVTIHSGHDRRGFHGDFRRDRRDRRRDRDDFDGDVFIGEWPQQGDTVWRSNSYNDWWHERPDRAFPRWVQNNQGCERLWWSGGGWRC